MKKVLFTTFLLGLFFTSMAQFSIKGQVKDQQTKENLVGASIIHVKSGKGTTTNADGKFEFELSEVPEQLKISYVGYEKLMLRLDDQQAFLNIELKAKALEEVVIKSIRGSQLTPITQKTVERKSIEEVYFGQDALFLSENLTPSIVTYSESGSNFTNYGQMRLRGIDQSRINITLDGVPLNDMIDQGVFFSNFTDFGNSVQSFQVQRGVGTSSNGTASYAGSINYQSIDLQQAEPSAELQLSAGSFNSWRGSVELQSGKLKNNLSFYSRVSLIHSDGYRYNSGTDSWSMFFSGAYHGKKDVIKLTGFTGRTKNELAYLAVPESIIKEDPRTNFISPNDVDNFGQRLLKMEHTHFFKSNLQLATILYYGGSGGDYPVGFEVEDNLYSGNPSSPDSLVTRFTQINYPLTNNHFGGMSNVNWKSSDEKLELFAGVHAYTFRRNNQEQVVPDYSNPYYDEHSRKNEVSAYLKGSYKLNKLSIYADVQFRQARLIIEPDENFLGFESDDIKYDWTFINPRVGLNYQLNDWNSLYASFGRSGREPTKIDIFGGFQLSEFNYDFVKNKSTINPEFVNDLEIGYRRNSRELNLTANFFYMDFQDEIAPIGETVPEGFVQLRKNVPDSYRTGVEIDLSSNKSSRLYGKGNITYMASNISTFAPEFEANVYRNVTPILSPEWIFNGTLGLNFNQNSGIELNARYISESFLEPTNQQQYVMPGFFVMNSRIFYQLGNHSLTLLFNNLTNQLYYTYGLPVDSDGDFVPDARGYFVQAPFNVFGTITLRF